MRGHVHLPGRGLVLALAGTVALALSAFVVVAGGATTSSPTPANKAVAAGDHAVVVPAAPAGGGTPILTATLRTSKPEDLILQVTLECSILTDVVVGGSNVPGSSSTSSAEGAMRVWVEVDGKIVPIQDVSNPPQDPAQSAAGGEADKVTFCDRLHQRTVTDQESPGDGTDQSKDYIRTKDANAFNWVRLNTGSGIHTIVVKADLTLTGMAPSGAEGEIGNRSLVVEPTKLANDAVIGSSGS